MIAITLEACTNKNTKLALLSSIQASNAELYDAVEMAVSQNLGIKKVYRLSQVLNPGTVTCVSSFPGEFIIYEGQKISMGDPLKCGENI